MPVTTGTRIGAYAAFNSSGTENLEWKERAARSKRGIGSDSLGIWAWRIPAKAGSLHEPPPPSPWDTHRALFELLKSAAPPERLLQKAGSGGRGHIQPNQELKLIEALRFPLIGFLIFICTFVFQFLDCFVLAYASSESVYEYFYFIILIMPHTFNLHALSHSYFNSSPLSPSLLILLLMIGDHWPEITLNYLFPSQCPEFIRTHHTPAASHYMYYYKEQHLLPPRLRGVIQLGWKWLLMGSHSNIFHT